MKGFFDFFLRKKRLFLFTERLSVLVSSGNSLQKSLFIMGKLKTHDIRLNQLASFLHKSLLEGTKFSVALSLIPFLKVPSWYISFISVAEECGALGAVLLYLQKNLEHEKCSGEKFVQVVAYPAFVVFLTGIAGILSVFYVLPSFSLVFGGETQKIQNEAIETMIFADFFLMLAFVSLVLLAKKIFSVSACVNVFRSISFLSENSVPIFLSLSCSFAFSEKDKRVSLALLETEKRLLEGEKIDSCFGESFFAAGLKNEGLLLFENLSLSQETGKNDGFERTAKNLESKSERLEKIFMSVVQPTLIFMAAIYICLILKTAFLPFITNFGGLF